MRGNHGAGLLADVDSSVDNGSGLHLGDLGIGDSQTAAAVTHHGVELVQAGDHVLQLFHGDVQLAGDLYDVLFLGGQELVERGIQETDGNRTAFHDLVQSLEVTLLIGQDLGQSSLTGLNVLGNDHLAHSLDTLALEEHVLGTAQADALCTEVAGLLGVTRGVSVGVNLQLTELVRPAHEAAEVAGNGSRSGGDGLTVDVAGGAVDGNVVALVVLFATQGEQLVFIVYGDLAATGHAAGTHAAGHNSSVRGHAAADGEDALSDLHTLDVLGRGLQTNQNDLLAALMPLLGVFGGEYHLAAGSAGGSSQALADNFGLLHGLGIELGMQQGIQLLGLYAENSLFLVDHALVHQVNSDLQSSGSGTLAVTGLQHVELAILNGELHVLHILVVLLQTVGDVSELLVHVGHLLLQVRDGGRRTNAGHHVFALSVDQILAEELLLAGSGVTGKCHASTGVVAGVAEYHGLHVNGGAPVIGDLVHAAVYVSAGVVPGAEHSLDGFHELHLGLGGEVFALLFLIEGLEALDQFLHVVGVQLGVQLHALFGLQLIDDLFETLLGELHNNVGEHLDETAIGVICKTGVVGELGKALDHFVVEAQVQDGVHHAGHGSTGAGTHGNQQRVLGIGELLADDFFHLGQTLIDLCLDLVIDLTAVIVILGAGLGGNGEALGNRQAGVGHFGQVSALAAQEFAHVLVAFREQVDILVAHWMIPPT